MLLGDETTFTRKLDEEKDRRDFIRHAADLARDAMNARRKPSAWTREETIISAVVLLFIALAWATNLFTTWPAWAGW